MIALSATLLLAPAAQAQTPLAPGEIVRVADKPILKTDFDHWREIARRVGEDPPDEAAVHAQALQLLIANRWIEGEAARLGIVIRRGAVYTTYKRQIEQSFPREEDFQKFLADSGQTVADIKWRIRLDLLSNRIRERVTSRAKTIDGEQRLFTRFVKKFTKRWKAKTVCGQGYDSSDCGSVVPLST